MPSPFPYSSDNKRYHTMAYYFKKEFGCRAFKVPVELGYTCPNRDGTKGTGGCAYCVEGGGGVFPGEPGEEVSLAERFRRGAEVIRRKWPEALALVYFQSFTSTYLPLERLRQALEEALALPGIAGVAIATRADCLPGEILDLLEEVSKRTWLSVELGLQTAHDKTAERLGRGHTWAEFLAGYEALRRRNIRTCVHLMNGLPGESREEMLESARRVGRLRPHGIKLHMLHLEEGSRLAGEYGARPFPLLIREEYVSLLCEQLELLPPETVIQRITGDPPAHRLIAPLWVKDKLWVRNALDRELARRGTVQGVKFGS